MATASPIGLRLPVSASATDIFVPSSQPNVHGSAVYRGLHRGEYLYRCNTKDEMWAIAASHDVEACVRCEGRVWIDFMRARVQDRMDANDSASGVLGGIRVGMVAPQCADDLRVSDEPARVSEGEDEEVLSFLDGASAVHVSCTLLTKFGVYSEAARRKQHTTVLLPSHIGAVQLFGDVVVRPGETVLLSSADSTLASLIVTRHQLRVARGGALELVRLELRDSIGGSAIYNDGEARAVNCSFIRCNTSTNAIRRIMEVNVPSGSEEAPPTKGAALSAFGGALHSSGLEFVAVGSKFEECVVSSARVANWGGAIAVFGGRLSLLAGTLLRRNAAVGGSYSAGGGAVFTFGARAEIDSGVLDGNEVRSGEPQRGLVVLFGGAVAAFGGTADIGGSTFSRNMVVGPGMSGGLVAYLLGGALCLQFSVVCEVRACHMQENEVQEGQLLRGGAISASTETKTLPNGASASIVLTTLSVVDSVFDSNMARGGDSIGEEVQGGALHCTACELTLLAKVVFRANSVSGRGKNVGGGAVCVTQGSVLVAADATEFVGNAAEGSGPLGGGLLLYESPQKVQLHDAIFASNAVRPSGGFGYGGRLSAPDTATHACSYACTHARTHARACAFMQRRTHLLFACRYCCGCISCRALRDLGLTQVQSMSIRVRFT